MATIETSVNISKPVEEVFAFVTNLDNQKKLSSFITGLQVDGPVQLGTKYVIETTSMGNVIKTTNEVVAFEPNKKFGIKTFAAPPASGTIPSTGTTTSGLGDGKVALYGLLRDSNEPDEWLDTTSRLRLQLRVKGFQAEMKAQVRR